MRDMVEALDGEDDDNYYWYMSRKCAEGALALGDGVPISDVLEYLEMSYEEYCE